MSADTTTRSKVEDTLIYSSRVNLAGKGVSGECKFYMSSVLGCLSRADDIDLCDASDEAKTLQPQVSKQRKRIFSHRPITKPLVQNPTTFAPPLFHRPLDLSHLFHLFHRSYHP